MDYKIKYYKNNLLGIRFKYKLGYVEYFVDSKYIYLFKSLKYKWQQKLSSSGDFTLYYINDKGNQVLYKRLITKAGTNVDVNTLNGDDFDLRIVNLVKYPHGKRLIKKELITKKITYLSPLYLNPEYMEAEDFFESDIKQKWKVLTDPDNKAKILINLSNGHYCYLKGNISIEEVSEINQMFKYLPLMINKKSPC